MVTKEESGGKIIPVIWHGNCPLRVSIDYAIELVPRDRYIHQDLRAIYWMAKHQN